MADSAYTIRPFPREVVLLLVHVFGQGFQDKLSQGYSLECRGGFRLSV
jgi:hypothetical protein